MFAYFNEKDINMFITFSKVDKCAQLFNSVS
ncbi:hypothetical protein PRUB_b6005 [Pseudoalteromonas rubra]|uniref:Uncharacterized protein n=1 Tax=Pseudoalteromonas rubra TaxID=43658 RepID=A0A8T0BZQ1_9GAMM|nr:hypothetical protein PRUB_b6005 [Pseudoalteromonas rubra]